MAVLLVVMLVTFHYDRSDERGSDEGEPTISAFEGAGLSAPKDPARVARVFGTDGGTVCGSVGSGVGRGSPSSI